MTNQPHQSGYRHLADSPAVAYIALPLLYWIGVKLERSFTMPTEGVAVLSARAALLLAFIVARRGKRAWILAAMTLGAEAAAAFSSFSMTEVLRNWAVGSTEAAAAWILMRRAGAWNVETPANLARFVIAGPALAALVGAVVATVAPLLAASSAFPVDQFAFRQFWYRDAVGLMTVTPAVLCVLGRRWRSIEGSFSAADLSMVVSSLLIAGFICVAALDVNDDVTMTPLLWMPIALYLAARLGTVRTALGAAIVAMGGTLLLTHGRQLFGPVPARVAMVQAQEYLFVLSSLALGFASLLEQIRAHDKKLERKVARRTHEVRRLNAELLRLALTDPLTGLPNRRALVEAIRRERERVRRFGGSAAVLVIDVDNFKTVNDSHGHPFGDEVLQHVARAIGTALRASDVVGRLGGEEFVVLAPESNLARAMLLAERIRLAVSTAFVGSGTRAASVTVSAGVALLRDSDSVEEVMARADAALYKAKFNGRNRVEPALSPASTPCPA